MRTALWMPHAIVEADRPPLDVISALASLPGGLLLNS